MRSKLQWILATALIGALLAQPGTSHAQSRGEQAKGDIAGTIGLGLIGAEIGLLIPPMAKLQDKWWAWALFPTIGAAGGAVAGVFAFDPGSPKPAVTVSILGVGLALAVPAIVGAVAWKSARDNTPQVDTASGGLLRLGSADKQKLAMPSVGVRPAYSANEMFRHGVAQRSVYEVSLVSGRF